VGIPVIEDVLEVPDQPSLAAGDFSPAPLLAKEAGFDTAILRDHSGDVAEGPGVNVVAATREGLLAAEASVLDGIPCRTMMQIAGALGIPRPSWRAHAGGAARGGGGVHHLHLLRPVPVDADRWCSHRHRQARAGDDAPAQHRLSPQERGLAYHAGRRTSANHRRDRDMTMLRRLLFAALLAAPIAGLLASPAAARDLTIVAGGGPLQDHMRTTLFVPFGAANNLRVADTSYDYNVGPIRAMVQARNVTWDVVMVEAPDLVQGCEDGVFEKIDWSIVNRNKFLPGGAIDCGAGAIGWGVVLFHDQARNPNGPTTYAEFWDVQRFPGKRALRRGARITLEVALMADGVAQTDVYRVLATAEGQRRAFAKLDALRPHLMFWSGGQQPLELVNAGEVAYAVGFVGRVTNAMRAGARYTLNWGTLLYAYDYWAVVRGSPHVAQAMRLIEFITEPGPLRELTKLWPINPVTAAVATDPEVRARNPLMMSNHVDQGLNISTAFWIEHGPELERRFAAWLNR
jgi:putative spermidine/putrescine transport system substrate-binding protein